MDIATWRHRNIETYCIDIETLRQRDKEIRRQGDMETWRHGDMETWRHEDMDMMTSTKRHQTENGSPGDFP
jgi:hypothetical protein